MKHYGDITQLRGEQLEPVDIIIGGSPCQNLSIAGNRQGLSGEQSSLFLEQIRIVKESRKCHGKPRFMLWENVPGALTSNNGEDFRRVLEETVRIKEDSISIPRPEKWANAGCIMGDGFSVAWRIHDAQYWGVPQRRRRIALVADFDGQCAGEILFEPEGLRGDSAERGETRQEAAGVVNVCINTDIERTMSVAGLINCTSPDARSIGYESEKSPTLCTDAGACVVYSFDSLNSNSMKSNNPNSGCRQVEIARTLDASIPDPSKNQDGVAAVEVYDARGNGNGNVASTVTGDHENRITDYTSVVCIGNSQADGLGEHDKAGTLNAVSYIDGKKYIIRRLTPLECERLQGFPEIIKADIENMSKDEFIALNLASGQIIADCKSGKVYTTKGPGGIALAKPKELAGTIVNGYRVVSIRNGAVKKQCRVHRVIWIAQNGVIPEGMVVDHINNDKLDNRIENLQLLTPEDNSSKASNDGLYLSGDENPASVISEQARIEIALWYQTGEFTIRQLAEKYGISKSRVHQIVKAYGWTDIGEWTDAKGKTHKTSDTARYKALGNSIALPFWRWLLERFAPYLPESPTMGSLFDGIGGFPLCWERTYGKGTAVWASEIEPFCIAVTERRINGDSLSREAEDLRRERTEE